MNKILIVESTLHRKIASRSLEVAQNILQHNNTEHMVVSVTNPLNIATAINLSIEAYNFEGVVALGCIFYDSFYNEILIKECLRSISDVSLDCVLPVGFGIIASQHEKEATELLEAVVTDAVHSCLQLIKAKNQLHFIEDDQYSKYRN